MKIPKGYSIRKNSIRIDSCTLEYMSVSNQDEVFNRLIEKGIEHEDVQDERIPYWTELWPSAIALSKHILLHPNLVENKSVLEIACGLGLPGIVAGMNAAHVRMSDYLEDAIDFAKANWKLNLSKEPEVFLLDWRTPHPRHAAQVLLASDIVYEKRSFDFILEAFKVLCHPHGVILFSEPRRTQSAAFIQKLKEQYTNLKSFEYEVEYHGKPTKIDVYELRLSSSLNGL